MKNEVISKATLLRLLDYLIQQNSEILFDIKYSNGEEENYDIVCERRAINYAYCNLRNLIENENEFNATLDRLAKEYMIK